MANRKSKYEILIKSIGDPLNNYYLDWYFYDEDEYYDFWESQYSYLDIDYDYLPSNLRYYKIVDMQSFLDKRDIKLNYLLGIEENLISKPTFSDLTESEKLLDLKKKMI